MSSIRDTKSAKSRESKSAATRQCKSAAYSWERRSFEQHRLRAMSDVPDIYYVKIPEVDKSGSYRSIKEKVFESQKTIALQQVRQATPTVNVKTPDRRAHVRYDAKRSQLERERQAQIARDNFILFKRLTDIMSGKLQRKYPLTQAKSMCIKTR